MMEKLGAPQTHLGLKSMIKEVDEDFDGKLSFREVPACCGPEPLWGAPERTFKCTAPWSTNGFGISRVLFAYLTCNSAFKNTF